MLTLTNYDRLYRTIMTLNSLQQTCNHIMNAAIGSLLTDNTASGSLLTDNTAIGSRAGYEYAENLARSPCPVTHTILSFLATFFSPTVDMRFVHRDSGSGCNVSVIGMSF